MSKHIVRLRYRTPDSGKLCYVYATDRGGITPYRQKAYRFNREDNALDVARILTRWQPKFEDWKVIEDD